MGDVKLNSTGGGSVTLTPPSTASNLTLTLPSASGTVATTSGTGSVFTNPTINGFTGDTSVVNIGSGQLYKDTSGNLGIGTSSPNGIGLKLNIAASTSSTASTITAGSGTNANFISLYSGASGDVNPSIFFNNSLRFATATSPDSTGYTERARIDSSGNLLVGKTSSTVAGINQGGIQSGKEIMSCGSVAGIGWENRSGGVTVSSNWWMWYNTGGTNYLYNGGGNIASINGTTGAYTALSDRNKKKDFEESNIGLDAVLKLKPTLFRMKDASVDSPKELGFIAQDVKDIIPQAYVEHELTEDAGGNASTYIGLSDRPIIAVLTKAIQELSAQNTALEARLAQLEAK